MKDAPYEDFVDRLRSDSDIVHVISDYVPLTKKGKNYWGCCPFHQEKTPSFSVAPDKGFFYCFGCQSGGDVFNFLMKIENISFIDAVKLLAKKLNIPLPEKEKTAEELARERERDKLYDVVALAKDFFHSCLTHTNYGIAAQEYLQGRGITVAAINDFALGFAPPAWNKLTNAFLSRRIAADTLVKTGLSIAGSSCTQDKVYDRFRNRIMFPILNLYGRVVGFGGRVLDDSQPKYLNSPETMIFNKRNVLYGLHMADKPIRQSGQAIIVEGYMDVIAAHVAGITNAVASLGTAFTAEQAKLLRHAKEIVFAYDNDPAGQNATMRALQTIRKDVKVKVLSIPDGKDPDEFVRKNGAEAFHTLVHDSLPLLDYQIKQAFLTADYSTLEGKVAVVAKAVPALANAENAVEINSHIANLSEVLAIDESAIRNEVKKHITSIKNDKNVNNRKGATLISLIQKPYDISSQAEHHLIRLMSEDVSMVPKVQARLSIDDIHNQRHRKIIDLMFSAYNKGDRIDDINWSRELDEEDHTELSRIMLADIECEDIGKTVDDCIRAILLKKWNAIYEQHRLRADELERQGDSSYLQELAEMQRIKSEINKIQHNTL